MLAARVYHNHPPGEKGVGCLKCVADRLNLDVVNVERTQVGRGSATSAGIKHDLRNGTTSVKVRHTAGTRYVKGKVEVEVKHEPEKEDAWSSSWNFAFGWLPNWLG
jgi:hypothetical protein